MRVSEYFDTYFQKKKNLTSHHLCLNITTVSAKIDCLGRRKFIMIDSDSAETLCEGSLKEYIHWINQHAKQFIPGQLNIIKNQITELDIKGNEAFEIKPIVWLARLTHRIAKWLGDKCSGYSLESELASLTKHIESDAKKGSEVSTPKTQQGKIEPLSHAPVQHEIPEHPPKPLTSQEKCDAALKTLSNLTSFFDYYFKQKLQDILLTNADDVEALKAIKTAIPLPKLWEDTKKSLKAVALQYGQIHEDAEKVLAALSTVSEDQTVPLQKMSRDALFILANCYYNGFCIEKSTDKMVECYLTLFVKDPTDKTCCNKLVDLYRGSNLVFKHPEMRIKLAYCVGQIHEKNKNFRLANEAYTYAAWGGTAWYEFNKETPLITQEAETAIIRLINAKDCPADDSAQNAYWLALIYDKMEERINEALTFAEHAAKQNIIGGIHLLGKLYVKQGRPQEAWDQFVRVLNHEDARFHRNEALDALFKIDIDKTIDLIFKLSLQDKIKDQYNKENGLPKKVIEAAKQGNKNAWQLLEDLSKDFVYGNHYLIEMAKIYEAGAGIPQDKNVAKICYKNILKSNLTQNEERWTAEEAIKRLENDRIKEIQDQGKHYLHQGQSQEALTAFVKGTTISEENFSRSYFLTQIIKIDVNKALELIRLNVILKEAIEAQYSSDFAQALSNAAQNGNQQAWTLLIALTKNAGGYLYHLYAAAQIYAKGVEGIPQDKAAAKICYDRIMGERWTSEELKEKAREGLKNLGLDHPPQK